MGSSLNVPARPLINFMIVFASWQAAPLPGEKERRKAHPILAFEACSPGEVSPGLMQNDQPSRSFLQHICRRQLYREDDRGPHSTRPEVISESQDLPLAHRPDVDVRKIIPAVIPHSFAMYAQGRVAQLRRRNPGRRMSIAPVRISRLWRATCAGCACARIHCCRACGSRRSRRSRCRNT
jgi:hypothetical protein